MTIRGDSWVWWIATTGDDRIGRVLGRWKEEREEKCLENKIRILSNPIARRLILKRDAVFGSQRSWRCSARAEAELCGQAS